MTDRTPGERLRVSVHEASHGVMAWRLGREVELLSIRKGAHLDGVAIFGGVADVQDFRRSGSAMGPARSFEYRRWVEHDIAIGLAGHLGEVSWIYPDEKGYDPDDDDMRLAAQAAAELVSQPLLSAYRSDLLARANTEQRMSDEDGARMRAESLTPAAEYFLNWMREEVRLEVRTEPFQRLLRALVPALLEAEVLPGETVLDICRRADRGFEIAASTR